MSRPTIRRGLIAGILTVVLTAAGAAPANARGLSAPGRAWHWLQDVWTQGVSAFWPNGVPEPAQRTPFRAKEGYGVDPNGATSPRPNAANPACGTCADQGPGVDPDG